MICNLPKSIEVGGVEWNIRWDYRPILDICVALSDPDLTDQDRAAVALSIFYPDITQMNEEDYQEALDKCMWFIGGGENEKKPKGPKLVDWEQDFTLIAAPVNHILGKDIRDDTPIHWFTFLSAYYEIGECTFSQVVKIRNMLATGKKMDKQDREWYKKNQSLVDFKRKYTGTEKDLLSEWTGN